MATLNRNLRVTMFAFKKDEISEEQFHNHWSKVHAPIVAGFLAKAGVIRYTQYHTPSSVRKEVREHYERLGAPHRPFPEYDGLVEIVVPNMETYVSLSKDPYYKKIVAPDEAKFFDWTKTSIAFGWEETYVENSQPRVLKDGVARL